MVRQQFLVIAKKMKSIVSVILLAFLVHLSRAQSAPVTIQPTTAPIQLVKTCKDFLSATTCDSLQKLIATLKESASTLQDAINSAVAHHKTKANETLIFIREYIAEKIQCDKILPASTCQKINSVAEKLKLKKLQVQTAIEKAVQAGAQNAEQIYTKVIGFLTDDITCDKIFSEKDCKNIEVAITKFHEQRSLLKEAIMSIAITKYNTTITMLKAVKEYVVSKAVNFKCEDVMTPTTCNKLDDLGKRIKMLPGDVAFMISLVIVGGHYQANKIYKNTIELMTDAITCENILSPKACQNFLEAAKKLHEQRALIQEALMNAAQKHITNLADIAKEVRNQLIASALNFKCTDVLPEQKCTLLFNIAKKFKLKSNEVQRIIIEAIVNGTFAVHQLYQATIGGLIADAKELQCEDLIDSRKCQVLKDFATRIGIRVSVVTTAVKEAIIAGRSNVQDIIAFTKTLIVDEASCQDFFPISGKVICKMLQITSYLKGITFDVVVKKIRELYANGVTVREKIIDQIKSFFGISAFKRSIDQNDQVSIKDELVDLGLQVLGGLTKLTDKAKNYVKKLLGDLCDQGKLKITNIYKVVKGIQIPSLTGDEMEDMSEVGEYVKTLQEKIRAFKEKAEKELKEKIALLKQKYQEFLKKFKQVDQFADSMDDFESMIQQSLDEQFDEAIKSFL